MIVCTYVERVKGVHDKNFETFSMTLAHTTFHNSYVHALFREVKKHEIG